MPFKWIEIYPGRYSPMGDALSVITFENEKDRERMYQVLGPKRRIIDTRLIRWNNTFGPSNNPAIALFKAFNKKGTLTKL